MTVDRNLLRQQNISTVLISLALIGCIAILLFVTYTSQSRIQDFALDQLRQDTEKRAGAVSYFFQERRSDLESLAEQRALSTFFENEALGMSMRYGLRDSLLAVGEQFGKLLDEKRLGGRAIYTRVLFMNSDGTTLAERVDPRFEENDMASFSPLPHGDGAHAEIRLMAEGSRTEVIATIPYYFKEMYVGSLIACIATDAVYDYLLRAENSSSKRALAVTSETGGLLYTFFGQAKDSIYSIEGHFDEMVPGVTHRYRLPENNTAGGEVIVIRTRIQDTPFYLVGLAPVEEILSGLAPGQLLFLMAAVCFLILGGMLLVTRTNTRKFVLQARLDEAARAGRALEEKNELLQKEIAERLQAEESLRNSEERFSTFMYHLPAAVFIKDSEGRLLFANQFLRDLLGFQDCIGKTTNELLPVETAERMTADDDKALNQGLQVITETLRNARGTERVFETHKFPVLMGRDVTLLGGISLDITERKRVEEEKEVLEGQLRQAQKMEAVGTLAGGIAHDFNNILAAIIGYAEMALSDSLPHSAIHGYLQQVLNAGHRAKNLVKQILSFSRMQQSRERVPVEIAPLIEEAVKLLRASLPTTIEIRQVIDTEAGTALADPTEIHQVLVNLCTNAAQAMEGKQGLLEVRLSEKSLDSETVGALKDLNHGPYLKLTVSDSGPGMEPAILERIFDPYFTTKEVGKGSGLGLAVVHGIVKRHQGAIEVSSEPGEGTTFTIYLPKIEREAAEQGSPGLSIPKGSERILLVDDEEALAVLEQKMLERLGYSVLAKTGSAEALEIFKAQPHHFDLVISDYTMPQMTGADVAREMIRIRPDIPVILCTGFTESITEEEAKSMGIRAFLLKPLNLLDLGGIVRKILDEEGFKS
jgi:PAS domain S-box-containing protein